MRELDWLILRKLYEAIRRTSFFMISADCLPIKNNDTTHKTELFLLRKNLLLCA